VRILATGDLHLGASPDLGPRPGDRLADQERVWKQIARLAIEEECEALLFAGDAFHRRRPTPSEILAFRSGLKILNEHDVDVVAIAGNHDVESAALPNALLTSEPHALYEVSSRPEIHALRGSGGVQVATLPWTPPAQLVASRNGGDRDALHNDVAQLLLESARGLRAQIPADKTAILLAHWSISGAVTPTGADVGLFREPVLDAHALEALGFDFVVAGHIHKAQRLGPPTAYVDEVPARMFYVGSPCVVDFGEAQTEHGVWIVDVDEELAEFVEIEDRPFVTVSVDLTTELPPQGDDETDVIAATIAERLPLTDAVIRIRYKASADQARRIDVGALRGFCADAGASKVYAVQAEIVREDRARVEGVDETLTELDALDRWIESQELGEAPATGLRERTSRYLEAA
jgi:exonuclease SbcD